jgi:hypothetical protein
MDAIGGTAMEMKIQDDKTIRKYLLGKASIEEQEEIELWLMSEDDACDLLTAAEDDLIDESLAGKLKGDEFDRFNSHFLAAPERKRKLQLSRSLHRAIGDTHSVSQRSSRPARVTFWVHFAEFIRFRPAFSTAISAVILVVVAAGTFEIVVLKERLATSTAALDSVQKELSHSQAQIENLNAQVQATANSKSPGNETLVTMVDLEPGIITRSGNSKLKTITITSDAQSFEFHLALSPDDTESRYDVTLIDEDLNPKLTINGIATQRTATGKQVTFAIAGKSLPTGQLILKAAGTSTSTSAEPVQNYNFIVVRR